MNHRLLKEARVTADYSREEAAKELHVSKRTYEKWEQGASRPRSIETYVKIAKLFGMSLDWWFENTSYLTITEANILTGIKKLSELDQKALEHIIRKMNQ